MLLGRCREVNRGPLGEFLERIPGKSKRLEQPLEFVRSGLALGGDKCRIGDHLPGHVAHTAATRAFNAILQYAFGKRGRPKFRRRDWYNSFESKEAKSTIIWRDGAVRTAGRVIPAILDPASAWQSEALKAKTKYCRIIRRDIRGPGRWYVQLVQEGLTPLRRETKRGVVGPNIDPSTIAAVAHTGNPDRDIALLTETIAALRVTQPFPFVSTRIIGASANDSRSPCRCSESRGGRDRIGRCICERCYTAELYRLQGELLVPPPPETQAASIVPRRHQPR